MLGLVKSMSLMQCHLEEFCLFVCLFVCLFSHDYENKFTGLRSSENNITDLTVRILLRVSPMHCRFEIYRNGHQADTSPYCNCWVFHFCDKRKRVPTTEKCFFFFFFLSGLSEFWNDPLQLPCCDIAKPQKYISER